MSDRIDKAWVERCLDGDKKVFGYILDKYQGIVFNLACRMISNRDDAADVTQNVFLKAYTRLSLFDPKYKFFSWLYRIAVNESLKFVKKATGVKDYDLNEAPGSTENDQSFEETEQSNVLNSIVNSLQPDYRIVIVLRHYQELTYLEISELLNIPEKTVKSRLFSARKLLREKLLKKGVLLSG